MKVELLWSTPMAEKLIEMAGRTSYLSFNKASADSAGKFIKMLIGFGHESVLEHGVASFRIKAISRVTSHQLVRHRLASYTQQSQRFVNEKQFEYVVPPSIKESVQLLDDFYELMRQLAATYEHFVHMSVPKEDARYFLPGACATEIVMTANFREWRHFIKLRGSKAAQWEIRQLAIEILGHLKLIAPSVFFDLEKVGDEVLVVQS